MVQYLVQIPETALFIIDCSWNMDAALIRAQTGPLVRYIRAHPNHTETPILLVSGTPYRKAWIESAAGTPSVIADAASGASAKALAAEYQALVGGGGGGGAGGDGVKGLSYLAGSTLFDTVGGHGGGPLDDPTYNSIHADGAAVPGGAPAHPGRRDRRARRRRGRTSGQYTAAEPGAPWSAATGAARTDSAIIIIIIIITITQQIAGVQMDIDGLRGCRRGRPGLRRRRLPDAVQPAADFGKAQHPGRGPSVCTAAGQLRASLLFSPRVRV
eukprot:SAG22_NODE_213_length_15041_cov_3.683732_7_plen_271_part_00